jgi:hypothetical protein
MPAHMEISKVETSKVTDKKLKFAWPYNTQNTYIAHAYNLWINSEHQTTMQSKGDNAAASWLWDGEWAGTSFTCMDIPLFRVH